MNLVRGQPPPVPAGVASPSDADPPAEALPSGSTAATTNLAVLERATLLLLCAGLLIGVMEVLRPFTTAILFGGVLAIAAWPLREALVRRGWRRSVVATLLLLLALAILGLPVLAVAPGLPERLTAIVQRLTALLADAPKTPPDWLGRVPLVGEHLARLWSEATRTDGDLRALIEPYSAHLREALLIAASALADSLAQLVLSLIVATMFWVNGDALSAALRDMLRRLGGNTAAETVVTAAGSVRGIAYGVVGTAAIQAGAMAIGLLLAGVPGVAPLSFVTLMLALSQIGAPLILVVGFGAAGWLFQQGFGGWCAFMVAWTLVVGLCDNLVRPWLISFGIRMPMALVILGVFGGFVSFGFLGLFIGPSLLAIAYTLMAAWRTRAC